MKILFDQGTPVPLRRYLHPHQVDTAAELGWSELQNGALLKQTGSSGYKAFVTTDQNLRHQQNLRALPFGIVVLTSTSWPRIQTKVEKIQAAVDRVTPGKCIVVEI